MAEQKKKPINPGNIANESFPVYDSVKNHGNRHRTNDGFQRSHDSQQPIVRNTLPPPDPTKKK